MKTMVVSLILGISVAAHASGWRCTGEDGFRVKLINHTDATRSPAVFVVSNDETGTLLRAKNDGIRKKITATYTRYSARATSRDKLRTELDWDRATLWVRYREGVDRPLNAGQSVKGYLEFDREDENESYNLVCKRYLKN